jgi:hypothetical protein
MKNTSSRNIQISQGFIIYTIDSDRQINTESDVCSALFKEQSSINLVLTLHTWMRSYKENQGKVSMHVALQVKDTQVTKEF